MCCCFCLSLFHSIDIIHNIDIHLFLLSMCVCIHLFMSLDVCFMRCTGSAVTESTCYTEPLVMSALDCPAYDSLSTTIWSLTLAILMLMLVFGLMGRVMYHPSAQDDSSQMVVMAFPGKDVKPSGAISLSLSLSLSLSSFSCFLSLPVSVSPSLHSSCLPPPLSHTHSFHPYEVEDGWVSID